MRCGQGAAERLGAWRPAWRISDAGAVMKHDFDLRFRLEGSALGDESIARRLADAGCEDGLVGIGQAGRLGLHFTREADSMEAAVESALADVRRALPGAVLEQAFSFEDPHVAAALALIRRVFGLSDGELLAVCGVGGQESLVERGEEPVAMAAWRKRMDRLFFAAANWERSGFAPPGSALTTPIVHEKTLLDLLCAAVVDVEAIQFVGGRMTMMREMSAPRAFVDPFR